MNNHFWNYFESGMLPIDFDLSDDARLTVATHSSSLIASMVSIQIVHSIYFEMDALVSVSDIVWIQRPRSPWRLLMFPTIQKVIFVFFCSAAAKNTNILNNRRVPWRLPKIKNVSPFLFSFYAHWNNRLNRVGWTLCVRGALFLALFLSLCMFWFLYPYHTAVRALYVRNSDVC